MERTSDTCAMLINENKIEGTCSVLIFWGVNDTNNYINVKFPFTGYNEQINTINIHSLPYAICPGINQVVNLTKPFGFEDNLPLTYIIQTYMFLCCKLEVAA